MESDIVARMRDTTGGYTLRTVFNEAAEEIERLRAQLRLANIDNFNTTAEIERLSKKVLELERENARLLDIMRGAAPLIEESQREAN